MVAEGVAGEDLAVAEALKNGAAGGVGEGLGDVSAEAVAAEAVEFIPVALEGVVV